MITIEQRFTGSASLEQICARLAPESVLEDCGEVTGFLAAYGTVQKASKIRHTRPGGSVRYVLEVFEQRGPHGDRYVVLTLDRDFSGHEALAAYRQFRETSR